MLARIDEMLSNTPHTFVVVSPLAEGADRLVAKEVLAWPLAIKPWLEVVLPLPETDYMQDFDTQESGEEFKELLAQARSKQTLGKAASRNAAYEQVGRYVAPKKTKITRRNKKSDKRKYLLIPYLIAPCSLTALVSTLIS